MFKINFFNTQASITRRFKSKRIVIERCKMNFLELVGIKQDYLLSPYFPFEL